MNISDYVDNPMVCKKIQSFKDYDLFIFKKQDQWIRIFEHKETFEHIVYTGDMHKLLGYKSHEEMINSDSFLDFINLEKKGMGKMPFRHVELLLKRE